MKRLLLLLLTIAGITPTLMSAEVVPILPSKPEDISAEEALGITKSELNKDVYHISCDYYLVEDNDTTKWSIFVDMSPSSGWEHKCLISTVPKRGIRKVLLPTFVEQTLPPSDNMRLMEEHFDPMGSVDGTLKPSVPKATPTASQLAAANRSYAIILNGGINKNANHERYWNDCSFIYQVLTKKYHLPKDNIHVLMSDGTDPADDMRCYGDAVYMSSPLDLDGDGVDDVKYAATKANLSEVFETLAKYMEAGDNLLLFVVSGGGKMTQVALPYVRLWGDEIANGFNFQSWFSQILEKSATINAVFGQSYSGGMASMLSKKGVVVTTASLEDGYSFASTSVPNSHFLYNWTSAINQADGYGFKVDSDLNGDNLVSMDEAYAYASVYAANSVYNPNPAYLGEETAFGSLPSQASLYIKDNAEDVGSQPNLTAEILWDSPSVWIRSSADDKEAHQLVQYSSSRNNVFVYAKIHNRGYKAFDGRGKYVKFYWSQAAPAIPDRSWMRKEWHQWFTGGYIGCVPVGEIAAEDSALVKIEWGLPDPDVTKVDGHSYFAVAAEISDNDQKETYVEGASHFDFAGSRSQAYRDVAFAPLVNYARGTAVFVRNPFIDELKTFSLSLVPRTEADAELFAIANVQLALDSHLYRLWEEGGRQRRVVDEYGPMEGGYMNLKFSAPGSAIGGIELPPRHFGLATFRCEFNEYFDYKHDYVLDLIQKDEAGNIIGGTTIIASTPALVVNPFVPSASGQIASTASDGERLTVGLSEPAPEGAAVVVSNVLDGSGYTNLEVEEGADSATLEVGNLKPGIYVVAYSVGGELVDTAKFTK